MKAPKNKFMALIVLFVAMFSLAACDEPVVDGTTYTPDIQGLPEDMTYTLKTRDTFDPLAGVFAFDPLDGDITDQLFVLGTEALELTSSGEITKSGTYTLTYTVINSSGKKAEEKVTVVITDFFELLADYEVGEYSLVWSEEFDYTGLPDSSNWNIVTGGSGFGNNEIQYYTDRTDNLYVDGEYLTITLLKEDYNTRNYTSGKITTAGNESWMYGKIEMSAKIPTGLGTWPAFWMMPEESVYGGWPRSGEIDIMEHVGYDQNRIYGTIHTDDYNGVRGTQRGGNTTIETASTEFHTYSIEWLPDKIVWSVDGEVFNTYKFQIDAYTTLTEEEYWQIWPFDQEFYVILNLAFGGNWGGAQGIDETLTSAEFVIDYVRVYQASGLQDLNE